MIPAPPIVTRSQWSATAATGMIRAMSSYEHVVVHHAVGNFASTFSEGKREMRKIQSHHMQKNGWVDIGYHFLIDSAGNIYQGRTYAEKKPLAKKPKLPLGAHVKQQNSGKLGVCLLGCYHPPKASCNDTLSAASIDACVNLIGFLCEGYGIAANAIKGHRDFLNTACPGNTVFAQLPTIRRRVKELLAA